MANTASSPGTSQAALTDLFTPKLVTVLREGYHLADLRADILAGLTVAIVALPLSMAIAIASGAAPERGLFTAAIGGFLISALGGSLEDVVRTRIYLRDASLWEPVARAHGQVFGRVMPANTLVEVSRLVGEYEVEIEAEAVVGGA